MRDITVSVEDLCEILGVKSLSLSLLEIFKNESPIVYRNLSTVETQGVIEEITQKINDPNTRKAGPEFKDNWEANWNENLSKFEKGTDDHALIPAFISSSEILRFRGNYIQPKVPNFEMKIVRILRQYLYENFFTQVDELHEFGAGTGFNLIQFCEVFPGKLAHGYDWSPSAIELIKKAGAVKGFQIKTSLFDMFNPDHKIRISSNAGLLTVGAMEQLGTNWKAFLDFMISKQFKVYVNIETIYENSQSHELYAEITRDYIKRRNWLQGYHQELRQLESEGVIEILTQQVVIGSRFHDSWSYTVWKLKNV
jgi:hypothetical protein